MEADDLIGEPPRLAHRVAADLRVGDLLAHTRDVTTRAEGATGTGEYHGAGVPVTGDTLPDVGDGFVQPVGERVQPIRPVQRDDAHRSVRLDEENAPEVVVHHVQ